MAKNLASQECHYVWKNIELLTVRNFIAMCRMLNRYIIERTNRNDVYT
jgi:hypothetical protein